VQANLLIAAALAIGTPFFIVFGWLSDRIGRKPIVMAGCLLAALTYFPIFEALTRYANPAIGRASAAQPVVVQAARGECSFQFNPLGNAKLGTPCDIVKSALAKGGVPYRNATGDGPTRVQVGATEVAVDAGFAARLPAVLAQAGYPAKADPDQVDTPVVLALRVLLVLYVTMVYGPIAAWLVELFPTRIRYTSMSLPYHLGNGWFGGFLPTAAFAMVAATGDIYFGLWYPIAVAAMSFVLGSLFLRETRDVDIRA